MGGTSSERDVSLASGLRIAEALRSRGHAVRAIDTARGELSIADDPALYAQWWEKIPVVLIDGQLHGHWRVSPDRLRAALGR